MIPVLLYPLFKKHNEVLALGAVLFRGVLEMVCYIFMVLGQFLLLSVSQIHVATGAGAAVSSTGFYAHRRQHLVLPAAGPRFQYRLD